MNRVSRDHVLNGAEMHIAPASGRAFGRSSQPCLCQEPFQPDFAAPAADCTSFCGSGGAQKNILVSNFHFIICRSWVPFRPSHPACMCCLVADAETGFARPVRTCRIPIQPLSTSNWLSFFGMISAYFCHISMSGSQIAMIFLSHGELHALTASPGIILFSVGR